MVTRLLVLLAAVALPVTSHAFTWSTCQTVTAVTNYIAYSSTVTVVFSPGVPGCNSDAPGAVMFRANQMNVTVPSLSSLLATALSAQLSGKQVMVFYDDSAPSCFANAISVGGTWGQCN